MIYAGADTRKYLAETGRRHPDWLSMNPGESRSSQDSRPPKPRARRGPGTMLGRPVSSCNPAIFLALYEASEASKHIQADDPSGCPVVRVTSATISVIPAILCWTSFLCSHPNLFRPVARLGPGMREKYYR